MRELSSPTVLVVRHGTTGKDDVLKGTMEVGLDANGRKLAEAVGEYIAANYPVSSIHYSPLIRGAQTAHFISKATGVAAKPVKALGPMNIGWMSGMAKDEAKDLMQYYISHPEKAPRGGEPMGDWFEEFSDYFSKRLEDAKRSPGKALVDVTHSSESVNVPSVVRGGPIEYRGTESPEPGSILEVKHNGSRWNIREINPNA